MRNWYCLCVYLAISSCAVPALAQIALAPHIQDKMVVQRGASWEVSGTSDTNQGFTATFAGQTINVRPSGGKWAATFDVPRNVSGTAKLVVDDGTLVRNVQVGDVWLCSGQSNMGMPVAQASDREEIVKLSRGKKIHVYRVAKPYSFPQPNAERWMESASDMFSAVCLAFGATLYDRINVPLGLIDASVAGTWIESWISSQNMGKASSAKSASARFEREVIQRKASGLRTDTFGLDKPSQLYERMIAPLGRQSIKGVLWYQGEKSENTRTDYSELLSILIRDWRGLWNNPVLPFVVIQLPRYGAPFTGLDARLGWSVIRDAQRRAVAASPPAGLAVTIDLGDGALHPKAKLPFGKRAADVAVELAYDQKYRGTAPLPTSVTFENNAAQIEFDKGRACVEGTPQSSTSFYVSGDGQHWHNADVTIGRSSVVVRSADVPHPVAVRYAWSDYPQVGLQTCGSALPITPFRSDDWSDK